MPSHQRRRDDVRGDPVDLAVLQRRLQRRERCTGVERRPGLRRGERQATSGEGRRCVDRRDERRRRRPMDDLLQARRRRPGESDLLARVGLAAEHPVPGARQPGAVASGGEGRVDGSRCVVVDAELAQRGRVASGPDLQRCPAVQLPVHGRLDPRDRLSPVQAGDVDVGDDAVRRKHLQPSLVVVIRGQRDARRQGHHEGDGDRRYPDDRRPRCSHPWISLPHRGPVPRPHEPTFLRPRQHRIASPSPPYLPSGHAAFRRDGSGCALCLPTACG